MKGKLQKNGLILNSKEGLDQEAFSVEAAVRERVLDTYEYGVIADSQMAGETGPFWMSNAGGLYIDVATGIAVGPHDDSLFLGVTVADPVYGFSDLTTGGERIVVGISGAAASWGRTAGSVGVGDGTGPYLETANGLTGPTGYAFTPQSSGAVNIGPLTDDAYNRIWISYIPTISPSIYNIHPITGERLFTAKGDGYDIFFDTAADPITPSSDRWIQIGGVTAAGGNLGAIDQSMMPYFKSRAKRVGITVGVTAVAGYTGGGEYFLDDHINALGDGAIASPKNPHRQHVMNLDGGVDMAAYQADSHSNGIIGTPATTCLLTSNDAPPAELGTSIVSFPQLVTGESVYIAGVRYTAVTPGSTALGSEVVYTGFTGGTGGTDIDTYNLFLKVVGTNCVFSKLPTSSSLSSISHILLGTVIWDGSTLASTLIQSARSLYFGLSSSEDIQPRSVESYNLALADGTSGQVTTIGDGVKTDHLQDGAVTPAKVALSSSYVVIGQSSGVGAGYTMNGDVSMNHTGVVTVLPGVITRAKLAAEASGYLMPTGSIIMYGGTAGPTGWLLCDGAAIPGGFTELIAIVGANTPDLRGRSPLGYGAGAGLTNRSVIGATGGAQTHALSAAECALKAHVHPVKALAVPTWLTAGGSVTFATISNNNTTFDTNAASVDTTSGDAHENMHPYYVSNFIIKT